MSKKKQDIQQARMKNYKKYLDPQKIDESLEDEKEPQLMKSPKPSSSSSKFT